MALGLSSNINKISEGYPQYRTKTSCTFTASDSDKIEVANHADLQVNSSDFSVSGWVKATVDASSTDTESGYAIMQSGLFGTSGNGNGRGFYVFYYVVLLFYSFLIVFVMCFLCLFYIFDLLIIFL